MIMKAIEKLLWFRWAWYSQRLMVIVFLGLLLIGSGGCTSFPSGFGEDLVGSTVAAVWGDVLFTILDYVLPRPPA